MAGDPERVEGNGADAESSSPLLIPVRLDAAVDLADRDGQRTRHADLASALAAVRRGHHGHLSPVIGLDAGPGAADVVESGCWTLEYIDPERCERPPRQAVDFTLAYTDWTMTVPGEGPRPVDVAELGEELASVIRASGRPAEVVGDLLGLRPTVFTLDTDGRAAPAPAALAEHIRSAGLPQEEPESDGTAEHEAAGHASRADEVGSDSAPVVAGAVEGEPSLDTGEFEALTRSARRAQDRQRRKRRRRRAAVLGAVVAVLVGGLAWYAVTGEDDARGDSPATASPELVEAGIDLRDEYSLRLWDLPPSEAGQLSVFSAGVLSVAGEGETLVLRAGLTGEPVAEIELDSELQWTTELRLPGETEAAVDAVGVRADGEFTVVTAAGDEQRWEIPEGSEVTAMGEIPLLHDQDGVHLLELGSEEPELLEVNPELITGAADRAGIIQARPGEPEIVRIPWSEGEESTALTLETPEEGFTFTKHLAVGHGQGLSYWAAEDQGYYVVHDLDDGAARAVLETPTPASEAPAWEVGRGMDLAIIENYAVSLTSGELEAAWDGADFTVALGPAAVVETDSGRHIVLDQHVYSETDRVIGVSPGGTMWVRQPDGSVVALSRDRGDA
ncbi:hypothetical protein Q7C18_16595 [Nesterenkonia sp. CL21]|uniref:hypothetical protein n=1 Tax=Nesterenkonia sp. CL21 TaxID=3064894 RepID=UPI002879A538|nr:hypothetical protein [Nesterenkonia sp. CL21]MDS2174322.1 hypothetical protein [Nesterenkonia sp. CL21]